MKDTLVTVKHKKREVITFLACFAAANLLNVYAVVAYDTPAIELFTSLGYVLAASGVLYIAWCLLRAVIYGITRLIGKGRIF